MKNVSLLLLVSMLLGCGAADSIDGGSGAVEFNEGDEIIPIEADDAEMNRTQQKSRDTLGQFVGRRESEGADFDGLLKVYFVDDGSDEEGEHMWVDVATIDGDDFSGILLSEPSWLKSVSAGDNVKFTKNEISDWLYTENGKAVGAYTVRLLRSRMSPKDRQAHDAMYPFSFD